MGGNYEEPCGAVAVSTSLASMAFADNHTLKIVFMATLEGPYTVLGEDSQRGFQMALNEFGNEVVGRPIEVTIGATDASPESALRAARKLVEQDKVDVIVGFFQVQRGLHCAIIQKLCRMLHS